MSSNAAPAARNWVWCDSDPKARNAFALFRRVLDLGAKPEQATLNLFADTRWRLRVNGAGHRCNSLVP